MYTYDIPVPRLASDQEKLPEKKKRSREKKGKKPSGEQQRRIPLQDCNFHQCCLGAVVFSKS